MDENAVNLYPYLKAYPDGEKRLIAVVPLPIGYSASVPKFYERKGREKIEEFTRNLLEVLKNSEGLRPEIQLRWDSVRGLTNIITGVQGSFDLDDDEEPAKFREHNLGGPSTLLVYAIATHYIAQLLTPRR